MEYFPLDERIDEFNAITEDIQRTKLEEGFECNSDGAWVLVDTPWACGFED
jgi:hypothetical protein